MSTLVEGVYKQTRTLHNAMGNAFGSEPGLTAGYSFSSNDSSYGPRSSVNSSNLKLSTVLKIEKGAIQINSTDGRSNEELGQVIMEYLTEKLSQADDILSAADLEGLLYDY
ncbi:hypothetical protein JOC86_001535 [Bacillus pakistanensis]|uniref:Uncharacterized protein n=1 Tax=Rossellomorea pakistanensis TaxID=992288 RepID=A0ABS2NAY2_9BACI|nr:hypothetical protein [Bacillus pakistanensis]MBM7584998.1 hypothetical protein [Bacillus pakistanensis]